MGHSSTHATDEWSAVVRAIEIALPFYESTSEIISLGLAGPLRRRAIGRLEIVDIGKPDGLFRQKLIELYVAVLMPTIARFFISGRTKENPFQMIVPTFHQLAKNRSVTRLAEQKFGPARLYEFLLGGMVIIEAKRTR